MRGAGREARRLTRRGEAAGGHAREPRGGDEAEPRRRVREDREGNRCPTTRAGLPRELGPGSSLPGDWAGILAGIVAPKPALIVQLFHSFPSD